MRVIKSLLLGAAAGLAATAGVQAADLPVKAKAVEYVKVCSAYGAGFYYIPGTDICLRVGGYLRADYYVHTGEGTGYAPIYDSIGSDLVFGREDNKFRTRGRGAVILDARTNTSYGTLRSYAAFNVSSTTTNASHGIGDSLDAAYIQFAGFTFGFSRSFFDSGYGYFFAQDIGHSNLVGVNKLAYTAQLGNGLSATLSLEDGSGRRNAIASGLAPAAFAVTPAGSTNAGQYIPDIVGNLRVDQAWGSAYVAAAASKLRPAAFIGTEGHTWGYGFGAGMEIKTSGSNSWFLTGAYAKGHIGTVYANVFSSPGGIGHRKLNGVGTPVGPAADLFNAFNTGTSLEKTTAWGVATAYRHYWQPNLRSAIGASYAEFEPGSAAYAAHYSGIDVWQVSANTIWSPVSGLDLGVEVVYSNLDSNCGTATCIGRGLDASTSVWGGMFRAQRNF